jgi:hypothetical protein
VRKRRVTIPCLALATFHAPFAYRLLQAFTGGPPVLRSFVTDRRAGRAMKHPEPWVLARRLCSVEGPTVGPDGWVLNVCSVSRPSENWPTRGGDITATHRDHTLETQVILNTSTLRPRVSPPRSPSVRTAAFTSPMRGVGRFCA